MFSDKNIISVTDKAAERVKYLINKGDENVKGLRIGVKSYRTTHLLGSW